MGRPGRGGRRGERARERGVSELLARALRRERRLRGLTIRALAAQSGVAANTLSLIENRKVSPSVGTLQRIASTLGVPVATFLQPAQVEDRWVVVSRGSREQTEFPYGSLQHLGAGMAGGALEPFVIRLKPGGDSGPTPIDHPGLEFVYCLEGHIEYLLENQQIDLAQGDSLLFEADLPHRWRNPSDGRSVGLVVLSPVGRQPWAKDVHFSGPRAPSRAGPRRPRPNPVGKTEAR
jgi:uncharacterized cupin superfamily protein